VTPIARLPLAAVLLALGLLVTIELLWLVCIMAWQLKQDAKKTAILERIATALSEPPQSEDISNPHASPELRRLVGDYPFDSPVEPASHPQRGLHKLSLAGSDKRRE
jgi:hypothetical protein